jgi:sodium-dependent phosphate cotransporter
VKETRRATRVLALIGALYLFFFSIELIGDSFHFLGHGFAKRLLATTTNPFVGLFAGVLATSIVQSSSIVTSITVALVAGGGLDVPSAIPIVMGSNMGTSVTNALVAAGHIGRPDEFKKAFAAAVVDDFFEILSILVLFPLQVTTNFLGISSAFVAGTLADVAGLTWLNPVKSAVGPAAALIADLTSQSGPLMLVVALVCLALALKCLVTNLKILVVGRIEAFFGTTLFKTAGRAMLLGFVLTTLVQSSSVSTSLVVPLAGIGVLRLSQIFPYALGANVGTTTTAMLAALVTGNEGAVSVAVAHLLYNVFGIVLVWPVRCIPLSLADGLAEQARQSKLVPLAYVTLVFFVLPITLIYLAG